MTYNMIKKQLFLHQALDYSQIYNLLWTMITNTKL
jgi:hypothetical protein